MLALKSLYRSTKFFSLSILLCISLQIFAQEHNLPMNTFFSMPEEIVILQSEELIHSSFKPLLQSDLQKIEIEPWFSTDSEFYLESLSRRKAIGTLLERKFFHEHLFVVEKDNFQLTLDPLFDFTFGQELDSENDFLYKNMRGFLLRASIDEKVSIQSSFRENQARFGSYITEEIFQSQDALGQGKVRELDNGGFDFSMASAYVSYSPSQKVNLQIGHGKHFIGNGIQSHFLSDRPYNYPYLRVNTTWLDGALKYTNLYTSMQELKRMPYAEREGLQYRKMGNFIFLDLALGKDFYLGFFEGRLWETVDTINGENVLPATAYIPVIGVNTLIEGLGNKKSNGSIGLNLRYDMSRMLQLYAQGAVHAEDNYSAQLGVKLVPARNLILQLEYNHRSMDTTYVENSLISYSHYSRNLAFDKQKQLVFRLDYRYNRFILDTESSYYSRFDRDFLYSDVNIGYLINPATDFSFNFGLVQRVETEVKKNSKIFYVSLRTNLQNVFYDI